MTAAARAALRANLEKLLASGRDGALLRFGLGQAMLQEGQPQPAAVHLQQATAQDPHYSAAWKLLGKALEQLGHTEEAEAAWTQGLAVAGQRGDMQSVKEITVFLRRLQRARGG
ncbi:tetratricopeptide repeat protein [Pseudorhodoferax sp. LjRoot39]|uniref:tetratricopeptide repeat protein n=1 Tax=Pseudorhodoferax sp. LjRoot39 TaxID=3342328 RepID=UPI003ECF1220